MSAEPSGGSSLRYKLTEWSARTGGRRLPWHETRSCSGDGPHLIAHSGPKRGIPGGVRRKIYFSRIKGPCVSGPVEVLSTAHRRAGLNTGLKTSTNEIPPGLYREGFRVFGPRRLLGGPLGPRVRVECRLNGERARLGGALDSSMFGWVPVSGGVVAGFSAGRVSWFGAVAPRSIR